MVGEMSVNYRFDILRITRIFCYLSNLLSLIIYSNE